MGLLAYLLATICVIVATHQCHAESTWRTIDAAYAHYSSETNNYHIMYSGDRVMFFYNGQRRALYSRADLIRIYPNYIPADFKVQAVVNTLNDNPLCLVYGDRFGYFQTLDATAPLKKFRYGKKRAFLQNGGPDAAARRSGKHYIFKGCMMAERKKWNSWGKPQNISVTMGLPCDVDAAWYEKEGVMAVLKGPQLWRWGADGTTSGPVPMLDNYELGDWNDQVDDDP